MALIRLEPIRELDSIQRDLNRLFGSFFDSHTGAGNAAARRRWTPAMDLVETDEHFLLRADLPGVSERDLTVELDGDVLRIHGERNSEQRQREHGYARIERVTGDFSRSLTLPEGIDPDAIKARFEQGVLEVEIPKPQQRKPRRVAISVAGAEIPASQDGESTQASGGRDSSS